MTSVQQQQQQPALDKDYDYYGGGKGGAPNGNPPSSGMPRVKKGLGAMPVEDHHSAPPPVVEPRAVSPPQEQQGVDPPGNSDEEDGEQQAPNGASTEGDEALLDLEQLEELHHEAERMKALGNKHMAAQV